MFYFFNFVIYHERSAEQTWSLLTDRTVISYHVVMPNAANFQGVNKRLDENGTVTRMTTTLDPHFKKVDY